MNARLKAEVLAANLELPKLGLVDFTWGNASGRDPESGLVVIKPSGVPYASLREEDMVVVAIDGRIVEGRLRPSSDLPTHLALYRHFEKVGGIVHTHSTWATVWAQACRGIPPLGTTHADYFDGEIPCTPLLTQSQVAGSYETETGLAIVDCFKRRALDPLDMPAVLVANHGPFAWGASADTAVHNAGVLELIARLAHLSLQLNPVLGAMPGFLLDRHFQRKHGHGAYYGQAQQAAAPDVS